MKKIGILTYYWSQNPGTFLQALSTLNAFQKAFPEDCVELIDYKGPNDPPKWQGVRKVNLLKIYETYQKWALSRERVGKYVRAREEYFQRNQAGLETSCYDTVAKYIDGKNYDLIVLGADTILELPHNYEKLRQPPAYWLSTKIKAAKVMCAASAGALRYEHLDSDLRDSLRIAIESMGMLGVRDSVTFNLLKSLNVSNVDKLRLVPDSTFTYEIDSEDFIRYAREKKIDLTRPTVGVDLPPELELCGKLTKYFKSEGYQVISPRYNPDANYSLALSPLEWSGMHGQLSLFITHHFHGTVFSLKHGTPVLTIDYDKSKYDAKGVSKTFCLQQELGIVETNYINLKDNYETSEVIEKACAALKKWDKAGILEMVDKRKKEYSDYVDEVVNFLGGKIN